MREWHSVVWWCACVGVTSPGAVQRAGFSIHTSYCNDKARVLSSGPPERAEWRQAPQLPRDKAAYFRAALAVRAFADDVVGGNGLHAMYNPEHGA